MSIYNQIKICLESDPFIRIQLANPVNRDIVKKIYEFADCELYNEKAELAKECIRELWKIWRRAHLSKIKFPEH